MCRSQYGHGHSFRCEGTLCLVHLLVCIRWALTHRKVWGACWTQHSWTMRPWWMCRSSQCDGHLTPFGVEALYALLFRCKRAIYLWVCMHKVSPYVKVGLFRDIMWPTFTPKKRFEECFMEIFENLWLKPLEMPPLGCDPYAYDNEPAILTLPSPKTH